MRVTKVDMKCFALGKYILVNKLASQYFEQEKHLEASRTRAVQIPKKWRPTKEKTILPKGRGAHIISKAASCCSTLFVL